ncbi:S-layer homology domain-containing protein [Oscillibacter sp. GMB15532]|uniref:S-layer homology domain-containing protein n=1 Tax=Oscillibacter sp. GMB15532 TaxID=3230022 RepID=UPI0034DEF4BE
MNQERKKLYRRIPALLLLVAVTFSGAAIPAVAADLPAEKIGPVITAPKALPEGYAPGEGTGQSATTLTMKRAAMARSVQLMGLMTTEDVSYLDEAEQPQTAEATPVTSSTASLGSIDTESWYYVENQVIISGSLTVLGDVHLILSDSSIIEVEGVTVNEGNSLTIYANSTDENEMGILISNAANEAAGIGGSNSKCGNITINGGNISASGGGNGAGIGSSGPHDQGGDITINGGIVQARGGQYAPGIGGRYSGGTITVNGGTVTATGGTGNATGVGGAAGIGSGQRQSLTAVLNGGIIAIHGGTVIAQGTDGGAGIGGGAAQGNDTASGANGGTVNITGGTVTATGGSGSVNSGGGAGIGGGGSGEYGNGRGGDGAAVTISGNGTKVTVTGGDFAPDIGSGGGISSNDNGSLAVTGGELVFAGSGTNADSVSFKDCEVSGDGAGTHAGSYNGDGNKISADGDWTVADLSTDTYTYTGSPITPEPEVTYLSDPLEKDTDFAYSYAENTNAGQASVTVSLQNGRSGSKTVYFTISKAAVTVTTWPTVTESVAINTVLRDISLSGGEGSVSGTFVWEHPDSAATETGDYALLFVPEDSDNYHTVSGGTTQITCIAGGTSGGSGGGGGVSFISSPAPTVTILPIPQPGCPTVGRVSGKTAGTNTQKTFTVTDSLVKAALEKAQTEAKTQNRTAYGIGVQLVLDSPAAAGLTLTLERAALNRLVSTGATQFEITGAPISLLLDKQALSELQTHSTGTVTLTIKPVTVEGVRNAFDITITSLKDGNPVNISSLGTGSASVSIPSAPGKNETADYLYAVHVDETEKPSRIPDSFYDASSGSVRFSTNHFSVYGVGYLAPSSKFTDISSHWAKESIDYVVGRGLFGGTSDTSFAPDAAMTRGMLVTALGRLAGVDTNAYTTNRFSDVKATSVFRPYIEWAYGEGIFQGTERGRFEPGRAVTREEIAVIFANYAKVTGYTLPVTRPTAVFADASEIDSAHKAAVTAVQQAGILMGDSASRFHPQSSATRAGVSAMLHRYIKLTIDPATAQGWALNDVGQYLYYKDGTVLTGTQSIDGVKYDFNPNGTLKTGWVQDNSGSWHFYFGNRLFTGWRDEPGDASRTYYFDAHGNMISAKWLEIDGNWYYFYLDGSLAKSTSIDGAEVDARGVRITN